MVRLPAPGDDRGHDPPLPARRDGTGYALILRNGLSPVIGRPPVIWRDRRDKRMLRHPPARPRRFPAPDRRTSRPAARIDALTAAAWTVPPPIPDATPVPRPGPMPLTRPPADRRNSSPRRGPAALGPDRGRSRDQPRIGAPR